MIAHSIHFSPGHINIPREIWMLPKAVKLTEKHWQNELCYVSAAIMVLSDGKAWLSLQKNSIFAYSQK